MKTKVFITYNIFLILLLVAQLGLISTISGALVLNNAIILLVIYYKNIIKLIRKTSC